jgi:hypothetical protein
MRAHAIVAVFAAGLLALIGQDASFAGGPRILIMEGGKHRVLLVERESRSVVAEHADFRRVGGELPIVPQRRLHGPVGGEFLRVVQTVLNELPLTGCGL